MYNLEDLNIKDNIKMNVSFNQVVGLKLLISNLQVIKQKTV